MKNTPPLHYMMEHVYFLYNRGYIDNEQLFNILHEQHGVYHVEFTTTEMSCYQTNAKTSIWI